MYNSEGRGQLFYPRTVKLLLREPFVKCDAYNASLLFLIQFYIHIMYSINIAF